MRVFLVGVPIPVGGGNVEAGDTALLWRQFGIEVTCLYFTKCLCGKPTIVPRDDNPWVARLKAAGIEFVGADPGSLGAVPGLPGSILVAFCMQHALHLWKAMKAMGCRLVWSPCMNYVTPNEVQTFRSTPPDVIHFQSRFQFRRISGEYMGLCQGGPLPQFRVIHGAFSPLEFRPRRYKAGEEFVVGRLARVCRTKWTPRLWGVLEAVRRSGVDLRALCMGWGEDLTFHCGPPPDWATCLPESSISVQEFMDRCHAMICPNWGDFPENWPRVGLEAMSAGVPLVVDAAGGWEEMGGGAMLYCRSAGGFSKSIEDLAKDPIIRGATIALGRNRVREITSPEAIYPQWLECFESFG